MNRNVIAGIAVPALALAAAAGCTPASQEKELLPSNKDGYIYLSFADAQREALAEGKLIMVDVWEPGCVWCDSLDASTFPDPDVQAMTDRVVFVKVNRREDTLLAEKWRVRGTPTLILMNADGTEIDRVGGYFPAKEFITSADDLAQGIGTLDDLVAHFEKRPDSVQLCMKIADKYKERWEDSVAEAYYQRVVELDPHNESGHAAGAAWAIAMGRFVHGKEKYDAALAAFRVLLEKFPTCEWAEESALYVPFIMAEQGQHAAALPLYKQYLMDYPETRHMEFVREQIKMLSGPE